jgi:hypothetical protein
MLFPFVSPPVSVSGLHWLSVTLTAWMASSPVFWTVIV